MAVTPEQQLWQAVIAQAMTDALGAGRLLAAMSAPEKQSAVNFFETRGDWRESLDLISLAAGFDPDYVRSGYEKAKKRGGINSASLRKLVAEESSRNKGRRKSKRK